MTPLTLRLIAAGVLVAVLAGIGWKVNGWRQDAARLPVVEAERDAERRQRAVEQQRAQEAALAAAKARAAETALQAAIAAVPKERLIYVPEPVPGKPAACPRLSDDFLRNYNSAVTGVGPG